MTQNSASTVEQRDGSATERWLCLFQVFDANHAILSKNIRGNNVEEEVVQSGKYVKRFKPPDSVLFDH